MATIKDKSTTLTLAHDQLVRLLVAMENVQEPLWIYAATDREDHEALIKHLQKAIDRLETATPAPTSQRVHLPKVEALLNELL